MNVLLFSPTVDTAGLGIGLKRAFDAEGGDWHARHIRRSDSWLHYPHDIQWDRDDWQQTAYIMELWRQADVLLVIEQPLAAQWGPRKPTIVWHLGTWFRKQIPIVHEQCQAIGALEVADMHDLIRRAGYPLAWLPDLIDIDPLIALRQREYAPHDGIRIAHAPTDRAIKSTEVIVAAIERLSRRWPIEFDLIEGVPNEECLRRKARCDIFVDELTYGYGLNALECWAMGIPDVSGIADPATEALMRADFEPFDLPFVNVTAETLESELERLIAYPNVRRGMGIIGSNFVEYFHSQAAVVHRAIGLFEQVLPKVAA